MKNEKPFSPENKHGYKKQSGHLHLGFARFLLYARLQPTVNSPEATVGRFPPAHRAYRTFESAVFYRCQIVTKHFLAEQCYLAELHQEKEFAETKSDR
ncbi:MAG: hypothetical protein ACRC3B_17905 [Bacteroidia bacterium]